MAITVEEGGKRRSFEGDIFAELKRALGGHTPARLSGLPPFTAGAVGFFSYDVFRQIERLPSLAIDELGVPDACLMFFDQVLAFDHVKKEILLIATADLVREKAAARSKGKTATQVAQAAYARAIRRLDRLEKRLARVLPKPVKSRGAKSLGSRLGAEADGAHAQARIPQIRAAGEGVHCVGRRLSVRALAAVRLCSGGGCIRYLSCAADRESLAVYVLPALRDGRRGVGEDWKEGEEIEAHSCSYCWLVAGAAGAGAWADGGV
jgi:hypothetical protein